MIFKRKNVQENLRRRFHHLQLLKRKGSVAKTMLKRPKRPNRFFTSPAFATFRKVLLFVLTGGILIGFVYALIFSSFFNITKVSLEKNGNAISGTALSPFLDELKGKNLVFLKTGSLISELEQTFKNEILLVRVKKSYPKKLVVEINEHPAVFNVRVITPEKEEQFVLNQIGYAILENTQEESLSTLIYRRAKPFGKKSIIINKEKTAVIAEAFSRLHDITGLKVNEGEWKKPERELHLKTEKNFYVWFDLTQPLEDQFSKLKRALPKLDVYNTPLQYIDLRIAGAESEKVIFKRR